jgi:hypothetical protein
VQATSIETQGTAQMTNEPPKIMADIAAEIEAKKAYRKALNKVRAMRKAGKSTAEIPRMGEGGIGEGRKALLPGPISKLESCVASIVNRGTLSPLAIGRQFGEEVGQLQVASLGV